MFGTQTTQVRPFSGASDGKLAINCISERTRVGKVLFEDSQDFVTDGEGQSEPVSYTQFASEDRRGPYTIYVHGTWDGATATLQISPEGDHYKTLLDVGGNEVSFTGDRASTCAMYGKYMRVSLTETGENTDLVGTIY